jgi:hypothetical protein
MEESSSTRLNSSVRHRRQLFVALTMQHAKQIQITIEFAYFQTLSRALSCTHPCLHIYPIAQMCEREFNHRQSMHGNHQDLRILLLLAFLLRVPPPAIPPPAVPPPAIVSCRPTSSHNFSRNKVPRRALEKKKNSLWTVCERRVDLLVCSLPLHRHSY